MESQQQPYQPWQQEMVHSLNLLRKNKADKGVRRAAQVKTRKEEVEWQPEFRGAALELQLCREREIVLAGSAETGKTFSALYYLDSLLRKYPNCRAVLIRKVQSDIYGTVLQTYQQIIEKRGGVTAWGGEKPQWFDYQKSNSRLWVAGLDNAGKILSGEYDFIYSNQTEQLSLEDWETLSTRCTGRAGNAPFAQMIGDCNPGPEDHWILKRPSVTRLDSHHEDNPRLFDADGNMTEAGKTTMAVLDALTGVRKQRLRYGRWVGAEGQFFELFDENIHVVEPFAIPPNWLVWGALDYGFTHPLSFGLYTEDNDGCIYKIAEHVQNKWLMSQHAQAMDSLLIRHGIHKDRLREIVAGHDVFANRGDSQGQTIADQFAECGYRLTKANVDRINGAANLLYRLGNPILEQEPTFKIFKSCVRTINCIPRMVHDPKRPEDVLKLNADAEGNGGDDEYDESRMGIAARPIRRLQAGGFRFGGMRRQVPVSYK